MKTPPLPLSSLIRLQLMKEGAVQVSQGQKILERVSDASVASRSSFGGTRSPVHAGSNSEHALVPLHSGPRVVGCSDPALRDVLLNVLSQEKRQSILSYGSYSIRIVRVQNDKLFLLLESAPDLLERPEFSDLFLGSPAGGLRFSAAQKPVRSQLGGVDAYGQ